MVKFTNSNILSIFRKQMGISKADETAFVEAFQDIFEEALLHDKVLKISGLGTFKLIPVESRKSVNVNTGEEIEIAGHYKLTFTPDVTLKDRVNEPLAHLETVELDADVVENPKVEIEMHDTASLKIEQSADYFALQEEKVQIQEDPLQKLTEQALELKDILADIQGLSVVESVLSDSSDLSDKSDSSDNSNQSSQSTSIQETPKQSEPISARDIIAEINREDSAPNNKNSKLWIWIAVFLGLSIIGLLVYQNRDFFVSSEEVVETVDEVVVVEESSEKESFKVDTIEGESSDFNLSDSTDLVNNESKLSISNSLLDTTSFIYSDKFSDIFNIKREYTEFIDTVTLNEGSRLTWISLKQYGHRDYWVYIYEANRDIVKNPNAIKIGTKLCIPKLAPELIDATNPETIEYARYLHDIYVKK